MEKGILNIKNLKTSFRIQDDYYAAVDNVSLTLNKNEVLAIVGEYGCGKSALACASMCLHKLARIEGEILYNNANLVNLPNNKMNELRGDSLGMIFQDPMSALNPLMIIGDQIEEVLYLHNKSMSKKEQAKKALRSEERRVGKE